MKCVKVSDQVTLWGNNDISCDRLKILHDVRDINHGHHAWLILLGNTALLQWSIIKILGQMIHAVSNICLHGRNRYKSRALEENLGKSKPNVPGYDVRDMFTWARGIYIYRR